MSYPCKLSVLLALCVWCALGVSQQALAEPRRGTRALCIDEREGMQFAWLQAGRCGDATRAVPVPVPESVPVPVRSRLPESDIVELLEQQGKLLSRARLLFAGNTECARLRARPFTLAAIEVGAAVPGGEVMAGLVFAGEQGVATVWARRSGVEYTAWNVACRRA